jgi:hypothetical protein
MLANVLLKTWRKAGIGDDVPRAFRELTMADGKPKMKILHFNSLKLKLLAQRRMKAGDKTEMISG